MSTNHQYSTHGRPSATGSQPDSDIPVVAWAGVAAETFPKLTSPPVKHITETQFTKLSLAVYIKGTQLLLDQSTLHQLPTVKKAQLEQTSLAGEEV